MKNISKTIVKGIEYWCVSVTIEKNKRKRKFFKSLSDAKNWLREFKRVDKNNTNEILNLSKEQMLDIKEALKVLPENISLLECVNAYNSKIIKISIKEVIDIFLQNKKNKVSAHYYSDIKNQLTQFNKVFEDWADVDSMKLINWIKSHCKAIKTQKHYFNTMKEFYSYAETKNFANNIYKNIHKSESPKVQRNSLEIPNTENIKIFFERLEEYNCNTIGVFSLVAFGGFRMAEAQRIELKDINFKEKTILLNFKKSKTAQTWLQINMPANVWEWLKKYPPNKYWAKAQYDKLANKAKNGLDFKDNALRHSFATYHLSLNRNAPETSILLRHTNPSQLWQSYLEGLTDTDTAKAYFNIIPSQKDLKAENGTNEDSNIEIANSCRTSVSH